MNFRVVAPFCTTLTHFKPPCHLVGQPFSEIKLKKNSGRFGYDYLIYCGSLLFFDAFSPLPTAISLHFGYWELAADCVGGTAARKFMTILPLILALSFERNPARRISFPLVA